MNLNSKATTTVVDESESTLNSIELVSADAPSDTEIAAASENQQCLAENAQRPVNDDGASSESEDNTVAILNVTTAEDAYGDSSGPVCAVEGEIVGSGTPSNKSISASLAEAENYWFDIPKRIFTAVWPLRAPLLCVVGFSFFPKLILLWIAIIITKPVCGWLFKKMPQRWKDAVLDKLPSKVRNSELVCEFAQGADQGLPFVLYWLYMCCAPFALIWMICHWLKSFRGAPKDVQATDAHFVLDQNNRTTIGDSETNFYHSKIFGLVLILFFASGIPALVSWNFYEKLGIERMMTQSYLMDLDYPNGNMPGVAPISAGLWNDVKVKSKNKASSDTAPVAVTKSGTDTPAKETASATEPPKNSWKDAFADSSTTEGGTPVHEGDVTVGPEGGPVQLGDATVVQGYNGYWPWLRTVGVEPGKHSVFLVHFYLVSLAFALTLTFFREWLTFPLHFLDDDHDVELSETGIKKNNLRGWFLSVLTINRWSMGAGPDSLTWNELKSLRRAEDGFSKLCPLPETAFKKESLTYKILNKLAGFMEGICYRPHKGNFLVFSSKEAGNDYGRSIRIDINQLNRIERAKLFYAVKKWAPHVVVHEGVEEQLLGSKVLKENRYTQLWFDILTAKSRSQRNNLLLAGDELRNGTYKIDRRLSSGGQATTYLATKPGGEQCVLKEFILATSGDGAIIESAREFEAEVSLLSQLDHSGIVKLQDFFSEERRLYVALEYIEGKTLREKVQQDGKLSQTEVVRIATSLCNVLEYLHTCSPPILHRDVTPENIIIRPDGTVKLIDFSLAIRHGQQTTDSCAKQAFTPPEQFQEMATCQSDIYSLGATMYFLLTGSAPKPISCSSPVRKDATINPELNRIVEKATQPDLSNRYESVHWLKLDLNALDLADSN